MASLLMPCGLRRFGRPTWRRRHSRPGAAPHAVMEAALSHVVRNKVEGAYARSDLFERWLLQLVERSDLVGSFTREEAVSTSISRFVGPVLVEGC